ncbi:SEL1-like repeat protein [Microbulbifer agarilyticus]|uniref:SEL1-like repeat protein n=1 Tax=Microbulbifer agarilyticus TaxID=260552 RepID=UPI001CD3492B|nr:SEL1-like repeat protein [Microbulbifer agarilyticus]MCA0900797.1 SEL1-like repeat protein [Microbulbifer agarilyticus]
MASPVNLSAAADEQFANENFEFAMETYTELAASDDPKAYYQLGVMHYKGLGVKVDELQALVWFSLAAGHQYQNANELVEKLTSQMDPSHLEGLEILVQRAKLNAVKQPLFKQNRPQLSQGRLATKIEFGDYESLEAVELELNLTDEYSNFGLGYVGSEDPLQGFDGDNSLGTNEGIFGGFPFFLVAEYDVAIDGSVRNISALQSGGSTAAGVRDLSLNTMPIPTFEGAPVHFFSRTHMGIAGYNKYRIRNEYRFFYRNVKDLVEKYRQADSAEGRYNLAMALMYFPWVEREAGAVGEALASSAQDGYPPAMYEHGAKLYREQQDPEQAVNWIYKAAAKGVTAAQYRLGRMLIDSPWVVADEGKALFWLGEAASDGHVAAQLKQADLKLFARDSQHIDVVGAVELLASIAAKQMENPEYHYLKAMTHFKKQPREMPKTLLHIRRAIDLGHDLNWDVSEWEDLLMGWTGEGYITTEEWD